MSGVPFVDLARVHGPLQDELAATFGRIARSGAFTLGAELEQFERDFGAYCETAHCVGVSDGTEALRLTLLALGAGPGMEVATVPSTFIATLEAIVMTGAQVVLIDIDPATRCMDPEELGEFAGPETAAVIPVHRYGRPAPMGELAEAAAGAPLLEDAAQAHGARLDGRRAGSLGTAAAFSFYPTKNLGALGDGGAVVTSDDRVAAAVRSLRHHGSAPEDANDHRHRGATSRLDNLQAALLQVKLAHLDRWNEQRRRAAQLYREALADVPVELPPEADGVEQVYHLFAIEVDARDQVRERLLAGGIGCAVHYPRPAHLNRAWQELGREGDFPAAERLAARTLSLPMFPGIEEREIEQVAEALAAACA
jgi:dTDP-4-amino-4,6-dideoxygalactose transaminase